MAQGIQPPVQAQTESNLYFGPFRIEQGKRLWRGTQRVEVRPRPLAVLRYLAERAGQLIPGEELFKRLWPGTYVTKTVLRVCVRELRQALDEDPVAPRFIETVGHEGYRFIGAVQRLASRVQSLAEEREHQEARSPSSFQVSSLKPQAPSFVGRGQELARLHAALARAQQGQRQVVFLSGAPGIGKTTLVDRFLDQILQEAGDWRLETSPPSSQAPSLKSQAPSLRIGRGQCIELHGPREAYLPLLEALGQLCRESEGEQVMAVLRRHAPRWLVQLSGLLEADEQRAIQQQMQGSSQERMLRELAEAVEALAADTVLVLILEDLQWSDVSTLDALVYLARRRRSVQLYIVGTYRPADLVAHEHPLRRVMQELSGQQQCEDLALELFTEGEVKEYLRQRLGQSATLPALSELIYWRTDGSALFLASFVDSLLQQGLLGEAGGHVQLQADLSTLDRFIPHNLQQVIRQQIERLGADEQQLLRVASVAGMTFTAVEVAGVVGRALEEVEEVYDTLAAREQLIAVAGIAEWPGETVTVRYKFRHALYQQVVHEQVGQARRVRLHRQLGEQKEAHYGERATEVAGELAAHFTAGREYRKAIQYHCQAGETALRRSAYQEVIAHGKAGLDLLGQVRDTPERQRQELELREILSVALAPTQGYLAEEVIENLTRARDLCQGLKDDAALVSVLINLGRAYDARSDRAAIEQLVAEELALLDRVQEPALALQLHTHLGTSSLFRGALVQAQEHHARVLALYDPRQHRELFLHFGSDPAVTAGVNSSCSLWLAGWPDQARSRLQTSLSWARELTHPLSLVYALIPGTFVRLWCGDLDDAGRLIAEGERVADEYDVVLLSAVGRIHQASIEVQRGKAEVGLSLCTAGLSQYRNRSIGMRSLVPLSLCFMADAYRQLDRIEEGLATIAEALHLTETQASRFWAAEVHRLKGELTLQQKNQKAKGKRQKSKVPKPKSQLPTPQSEAEACFLKAIAIARQQEAKSLELRAAMSLSRLWQDQGKRTEAHQLLAEIYGWFTEGFDTADLREAKALLDALRA